jgi:ABC-type antimicrobial peptide transport system permease subunit
MRHSTVRTDFQALLLTVFALSALVLAAIGVYGLMVFSVQQRTRELGIRLALGATPREVQRIVVRQAIGLTAVGVAVGAAASMGLARYLSSMLYGVKPVDPASIVASCLMLSIVAVAAAYLPARRASGLDPIAVLRSA